MSAERLDKILAGTGAYTRSSARAVVAAGLVTVDGAVVRAPEAKTSRASEIRVRGERLDTAEFVYYMMNKPAGYVSASKREGRYPPVTELLPEHLQRRGLFCVGRLDADVTGLLLLTDDGGYAHRVTAPRSDIPKTYAVTLDGPLTENDARALAAGVVLRDGTSYRPAALVIGGEPHTARVTVTEGKYHEVKNLMAFCGRRVVHMSRLSIGALTLDPSLPEGSFRRLDGDEMRRVFI